MRLVGAASIVFALRSRSPSQSSLRPSRQDKLPVSAFDDECTHEQCSLAEYGELAGTILTCTCHGSEFDVQTGKVLAPPATVPVKVYRVRVAGDALQIEV